VDSLKHTNTPSNHAYPTHVALIDQAGVILVVNEPWRNFSETNPFFGPELTSGMNYVEACEQAKGELTEIAIKIAHGIRDVLSGNQSQFYHDFPLHTSTELRWFRLTVSQLGSGHVLGAVISYSDITNQLITEESLRVQVQILDNIGQAVIATDIDGDIIYANRFAGELYGWPKQEMIGQNTMAITVPQTSFAQANRIMEQLRKGKSWSGEFMVRNRAGKSFPALVTNSPLQDREGKLIGIITISSDLSERKKLEQQFLRAQRMEGIGTLAGGIAHDLNNILAPVLMSVQMLRDMIGGNQSQELLNTLESSLQRGSDLVKQVLAFARGVEGERAPVNIYYLVNEIQKIVRDTFPKSLKFNFNAPHDVWPVLGDSTQLQQVILNLCVNARDAMLEGGELKVTLQNIEVEPSNTSANIDTKPGSYVLLKVSDTGPGISPMNRERIFEPFFTTKEFGKGTGLGLSTTLAIVRSHGGHINLSSTIGKGTTFDVYLPAAKANMPIRKEIDESGLTPRGNGELILVVDDEEAIRKIAQKMLEMYGYKVVLASQGEEALKVYRENRSEIAAIITDMAMPIMDGPTMIIALKEMDPNLTIIGSSGLTSNISVTKAAGAGVQHFISKPYTADAMLKTLRNALQKHAVE